MKRHRKIFDECCTHEMEAKAEALQVDQVVSPTTPRDGLMMKPKYLLLGIYECKQLV